MNCFSRPFSCVGSLLKSRVVFWLLSVFLLLVGDAVHLPQHCKHGIFYASPFRVKLACVVAVVLCALAVYAYRRRKAFLPSAGKMWCLFALACLSCLVGNLAVHQPASLISVPVFSVMGFICLSWGVAGRWSLLFWVPFFFVEILQVGLYYQYGIILNHQIILPELLEASYSDVIAFLNPYSVLALLACLAFSCMLAYLFSRWMRNESRTSLLSAGCIALLLSGVVTYIPEPDKPTGDSLGRYVLYPEYELRSFARNLRLAAAQNEKLVEYVRALPSPAEQSSSIATVREGQGVVVVLHIGESVRADRLSLNGYLNQGRSTTPWLDSQKGQSLINFSDCISSAGFTCPAMIALLTDARRDVEHNDNPAYEAKAGSVLDLFDANHFAVYTFHGPMLAMSGKFDKVIRELTLSARKRFYAPGIAHTVIPSFDEVLKTRENVFLFVNNEGSHIPYYSYDHDSAPFLPQPPKAVYYSDIAKYERELNNAYDNTIHYTDDFIRKVVEKLKGRPFIYLYVSDHGEYLGHDGMWWRGDIIGRYHETTGSRVGMFIIISPELEALHPHLAQGVRNLRRHADMTVGHEHIYHTLLGIFGISTPYYDAELDLSSEAPEPYSGPQPPKL